MPRDIACHCLIELDAVCVGVVVSWLRTAMPIRRKLSIRDIDALAPSAIAWDGTVIGLGARRYRSGITFFLKYRTRYGRQRWFTIGRYGSPWTPETARRRAQQLLVEIANGADPATEKESTRKAITVAELCARYLADAETGRLLMRGGRPKKASTLANDRSRIESHIIPLLGRLPVGAVTRQDVEHFMHAIADGETRRSGTRIRGGRIAARRTVNFLGALFVYAVERHLRADNPVRGIRKFAENKRERRLTDAEYTRLGDGLRASVDVLLPSALAALRFLALTGWRAGEALALHWREVHLVRRTATLEDTKTGRSMRPLSNAACEVLRVQPYLGDDALVFGGVCNYRRVLQRVLSRGGLPSDISAHTLRHSFASLAGDLGYSEATIGALIGHRGQSMTSRYMHYADAVLLAAADAVASETARRMGEATPTGAIVPLRA
jgi:integrase